MSTAPRCGASGNENAYGLAGAENIQEWFAEHVKLDGKAYTLDRDQANAVLAMNLSTLVVARAGSGKTRVIVAKIAYLIAHEGFSPEQILVFMFNRTAAAEVNQRIASVEVDGQKLVASPATIASTFHKFALDVAKSFGKPPQIISEAERDRILDQALDHALKVLKRRISPSERRELRGLVSNFINRAGQKYPGLRGQKILAEKVTSYIEQNRCDPAYKQRIFWHQVAYESYRSYIKTLTFPKIDFNMLMALATELLQSASELDVDRIDNNGLDCEQSQPTASKFAPIPAIVPKLHQVRFIMIDEYQDFSYLFLALTDTLRRLTSQAKLFAVGDDWQAINRFAGSDVDYFINFEHYFPDDTQIIPLATNYRSDRRIVERANEFMLREYDSSALPAKAFSSKKGKIHTISPSRVRFRPDDLAEDGLGDGRYLALARSVPAAKLLKLLMKIIRHHRHSEIMLLHRHNYTSFDDIDLPRLLAMLEKLAVGDHIMTAETFRRQVRCLTMHRSKGLEADVVLLLELDQKIVRASHPHATIFELFDDTLAAEIADQQRLLYVAMTRARHYLYLLSNDKRPPV